MFKCYGAKFVLTVEWFNWTREVKPLQEIKTIVRASN